MAQPSNTPPPAVTHPPDFMHRIAELERQVADLRRSPGQRLEQPSMMDLVDSGPMYRTRDGHAPSFSRGTGPGGGYFVPRPVLAELIFHWRTSDGALTAGVSDKHHARWPCDIVGCYVKTTTFGSNFTQEVYVNGVLVPGLSCAVTGSSQLFTCQPLSLVGPSDDVTVNAPSPGTGNLGVVVHVLLG